MNPGNEKGKGYSAPGQERDAGAEMIREQESSNADLEARFALFFAGNSSILWDKEPENFLRAGRMETAAWLFPEADEPGEAGAGRNEWNRIRSGELIYSKSGFGKSGISEV